MKPLLTRLKDTVPVHGYCGDVYKIEPPITFENGKVTEYITSSYGLEMILGDNNFAVFPSDEHGKFLTWEAIYSDGEGPDWATQLM